MNRIQTAFKFGLKVALGFVALTIIFVVFQLLMMKHRADSFRKKIQVGAHWSTVAPVVDADPNWFMVFFRDGPKICGAVHRPDGFHGGPAVLEFPRNMETGQNIQVRLANMMDSEVVAMRARCRSLTVLYKAVADAARIGVIVRMDSSGDVEEIHWSTRAPYLGGASERDSAPH